MFTAFIKRFEAFCVDKSSRKGVDIEGTRLQIAIIVEEGNAQNWNLPYYKVKNLNLECS